jgi:GlcNAc-P-P-Und epimerase
MVHVSIVGGSGFIGTRLAQRLQQSDSYDVAIVDKAPSAAFPGLVRIADVRSVEQLRAAVGDGTVIVNLAAEHRDDVRPINLYHDVNVGGAQNLCTVARERNVRTIVFTSSVAVYGFAPVGTSEAGAIAPFNHYGRSKFEAEQILSDWQRERPAERSLCILRPTVVFGEQNRGNVYNLLRQIAIGRFMMIGNGQNRKSIAYVENVAACIEMAMAFKPGIQILNYVDQPDFTMNELVLSVYETLGKPARIGARIPYWAGYAAGKAFDVVAHASGHRFPVSAIRVQKFCANSVYASAVPTTGFVPPMPLAEALKRTVRHEFMENHSGEALYFSE